jgi:hypothetical protein
MTALHLLTLTLPVLLPGLFLIVSLKRGWFGRFRRPVDGGAALHGTPLVGQNKTWFGVALYVAGGALVAGALSLLGKFADPVFAGPKALLVGASIGAAYSVGEIINSLVKRRAGIAPGQMTTTRWRHLQRAADLADGIVCASLVYLAWGVSLTMAAAVLVAGLVIHVGTDMLMRRLSLKRDKKRSSHHGDRHVVEPAQTDALDRG